MRPVSSSSGSEMPSMPRWYRLSMTGIHSLSTTNCRIAGVVVVEVSGDADEDGEHQQRRDEAIALWALLAPSG